MYKKQSKITEYFISLKFIFCMYKMYPISAEGYKNAKVGFKIVRKTGHLGNMKDVGSGMGVKNIYDLVLKEIHERNTV